MVQRSGPPGETGGTTDENGDGDSFGSFLVTKNVWPTIANLLGEKTIAAIGYVGKNAAEILPLPAGSKIVIDGSETAVKCGATVPAGVEGLLSNGVSVFSIEGLHSKMLWTDSGGGLVVVGSANASHHSTTLIEAVVISDDTKLCADVYNETTALIDLAAGDGELDLEWVRRMAPLAPDFRQLRPHRASPRLPKRIPRRIWIFPWALDRKALSEAEEEELARMARLHGSSRVRQTLILLSVANTSSPESLRGSNSSSRLSLGSAKNCRRASKRCLPSRTKKCPGRSGFSARTICGIGNPRIMDSISLLLRFPSHAFRR